MDRDVDAGSAEQIRAGQDGGSWPGTRWRGGPNERKRKNKNEKQQLKRQMSHHPNVYTEINRTVG
jgi:hypothetical protein